MPTGTVSLSTPTILEGDDGTRTATVFVSRFGGEGAFSVDFATQDFGATAGEDYDAISGTLSFGEFETTKSFTITIRGDTTVEGDELILLQLSNATNGAVILAQSSSTALIVNDDPDDYRDERDDTGRPLGLVTIGAPQTGNIERPADHDWFELQLTAGAAIQIDLRGSPSGAGTLSDPYLYLYDSAGILLASNDDAGFGLDSLIYFRAPATGTYYVSAGAYADSGTGTYQLTASDLVASLFTENADSVTLPLAGLVWNALGGNDTVTGSFGADTIAGGTGLDLVQGLAGNDQISGDAGDDTLRGFEGDDTLAGGAGNDEMDGGLENDTARWSGSSSEYAISGNVLSFVITDQAAGRDGEDVVGGIEFLEFTDGTFAVADLLPDAVSITGASISEGNAGTRIALFTVSRVGSDAAFTVDYATADSSATATDGDYVSASGTLVFAEGIDSQTIAVTINGDTRYEPFENFIVSLSNPTGDVVIIEATGVGFIDNDDVPVAEVVLTGGEVIEGDGGTKQVTFNAVRSGGSLAFSVDYATSDFSGATAGEDYVATAGTLHFAEGENSRPVTVTIIGDTAVEFDEGFRLALSNATNGVVITTITPIASIVSILNDDPDDFADELADTFRPVGQLSIGATLNGTMEFPRDTDLFAVELVAGAIVQFDMRGGGSGAGTLYNPTFEIYDSGGVQVGFSNYVPATNDARLILQVESSGTYYLRARTGFIFDSGTYTLSAANFNPAALFTEGPDDVALPFAGGTWHGLGGDDFISGTAGADTIDGDGGSDRLAGGGGDDTYYVDTYLDRIFELFDGGTDTIYSNDNYIMPANVENLTLLGTAIGALANDLANVIIGNDAGNLIAALGGNDTVTGADGDDVIDGGTGDDSMSGGAGADVYHVDSIGDAVIDVLDDASFDLIWTAVSMTLPDGVEIAILLGGVLENNVIGNDGPADITPNLLLGNNAANSLTTFGGNDILLGLDGNDTLSSGGGNGAGYDILAGGLGADSLTGGAGHDFFAYAAIGEAGDTIADFDAPGGPNQDILDLRVMWPTLTNTTGISTVAAAVASGHLAFQQVGADTQVLVDADGGAHAVGEQVLLVTLLSTTAAAVQNNTLI